MAFTWQVELYRKLIDDIVGKWESKVKKEEEAVKNLPSDWEEKLFSMPTGKEEEFDAFAKALRKIPTTSLEQSTDELMAKQDKEIEEFEREYGPLIPAGSELEKRRDAYSGKSSFDYDDPFGLNDPDPVEGISYEEFYESLRDVDDSPLTEQEIEESNAAADAERYGLGYKEKDKLKLDWVNEILKEFPEEKAPEVLRLPQWKDEEKKPDMSPFLSYLLRQSPYARLPVAGLLGLGLMGYSKPAY